MSAKLRPMFSLSARRTLAVGLVLCGACQRYFFEFQPASTTVGKHVDLTVDRPSEADILFIVDSSGSMKPHQENLKRNITAFIETLAQAPQKFQIGVTTTDLNGCEIPPTPNPWDGKCGRLLSPDGADPIMRRVDYADNNAALIARFQQTIEAVGTGGSGYEQGLKAAIRAVEPDLVGAGKPNSGFLRPAALLGLVFLSDEWDCSYSDDPQLGSTLFLQTSLEAAQSCYELKDQLEKVTEWANRAVNVKGRPSLIAVGAITGGGVDENGAFTPGQCLIGGDGNPSTSCSCFLNQPTAFCKYTSPQSPFPGSSTQCGPSTSCCSGASCCTALGSTRYTEFADTFRLRFNDSICRSNYGETLVNIANILKRDCFPLDPGPAQNREDLITVKRRGVGETEFADVPQVPSDVGFAGDGWFLFKDEMTTTQVTVSEVCLAGSYKRVIGDAYEIKYVAEATGLDSDEPAE